MKRSLVLILLALALLAQASPLRTCQWETMLRGASCHEGAGSAAGPAAARPGVHAEGKSCPAAGQCVCETPKGGEDRRGGVAVAALAVAPELPCFTAGVLCPGGARLVRELAAAREGPAPPLRTPLLI